MNVAQFRELIPFLSQSIFLNHAATCPVLSSALDRAESILDEMNEPLSFHVDCFREIVEETRNSLAQLFNISPSSLAFTPNTSTSLSMVAHSVSLKPGDKVLMPQDEFPSNRYVWQNLENRGIDWGWINVKKDEPIVETLSHMNLDRVKLISLSAVSYFTGRKYDLKAFSTFCRERNIFSCLDAIQAVGTMPFDLSDIGVDFVAGDARKWLLSPMGCGYLYINPAILETLYVPIVGWMSVKNSEECLQEKLFFSNDAARFEPASPNVVAIAGLNQSLKELSAVGWQTIYKGIASNVDRLTTGLCDCGIELMAPKNNHSGIVSFFIPDSFDETSFDKMLAEKKIIVTKRAGSIRISPHFYSTKAELDAFLDVIDCFV